MTVEYYTFLNFLIHFNMASFHHNSVHQAISMYSVAADMENYLAEVETEITVGPPF